MVYVMLLL